MSKIAIFTLTEQRDTVVDNALAYHLRTLGHEVMVRHFAMAAADCVCFEKPDTVIVPMVGSLQKLDVVKHCHAWGVNVIVRRGEAGAAREVLAGMDAERRKVIIGAYDYAPYVDLELVWGPEFADVLAEAGRMPRAKSVPCGPFTLDACFNRPRPQRAPGRRTLLFATAWSGADDDPHYTECGVARDSPLQNELYWRHRAGRDEWLRTIRSLYLTKAHKYDFLLKVRPGEATTEYSEKLGAQVNVLPYAFPSADAILMSDCVIHAGSTMAIEAHLLGVPSINYTNCNPDPRLADVTVRCADFGELEAELGRLRWGQSNIDPAKLAWLQEHLYGSMDGKACERGARAVHALLKTRTGKNKNKLTIPGTWPHEVLYPTPEVSAVPVLGWQRLVCLSCKGLLYAHPHAQMMFCPYCALTMRRTVVHHAKLA